MSRTEEEATATANSSQKSESPVTPPEKQAPDLVEIIVDWDGPDDPANPKNWPYEKKWRSTVIVSLFTFLSPVSSSMIAPAVEAVAKDFHITSSVILSMTVSVFVLAYAFGPLFLGPLSEMYGRVHILQLSNAFYFVWNLVCGFAQNKTQLVVFRFFAGLGGSAPLAVGGGVLSDIWRPEERGRAIAIYSMAPLLGPVLGPVVGAWIAEKSTWRWVFWSTSIFTVLVQAAGLFYLRESYPPVLLHRKAARIRAQQDQEILSTNVRTIYEVQGQTTNWQSLMARSLVRPFALFIREPIVQVIGLYMSLIYGVFYLYLTTIPAIFRNVYHQGVGIGGLHYIALGLGVSVFSQINARYMDKIYIALKKRNGGNAEPEYRVPSMIPGSLILPLGLMMTGWAAEKGIHWIMTDIGIALVGGAMILSFQSMQAYIVDTFTLFAASALAATAFFRSLAGFGFPLFAPSMYARLGYGWGTTLLALISIVLGWPAPFLFWKFGKAVRMRSRYVVNMPKPAS